MVPRVRPVHHSVYTPEESAALQRSVGALHAFGLRPVAAQEDRPFGRGPGAMHPEPAVRGLPAGASGPPLHFLPPVHTLGRFSDEVRPGCHPATLQVLQQALDAELIRLADAARAGTGAGAPRETPAASAASAGYSAPKHVPVPLTLAERLQKTTANKGTQRASLVLEIYEAQ